MTRNNIILNRFVYPVNQAANSFYGRLLLPTNSRQAESACFYWTGNYPITKHLAAKANRMAELRTQEQQLLSALESLGGTATVEQLIQACGIQDTAVMRTALTLQEKNFVSIRAKIQNVIKLTPEG